MKRIVKLFCLFLLSVFKMTGQTITVLEKGDTLVAPENKTIVMDKYTFGKYHYTSEKYDTLKAKIIEYDSLLIARDSVEKVTLYAYKNLLTKTEYEKQVYKSGYSDLIKNLKSSIDRNQKLQVDYKVLEHKNRRIKRWRNIFLGSTVLSTGILILIVAI